MDIETFNNAKKLQTVIKSLKQEYAKVALMQDRADDAEFNELRRIVAITVDQLIGYAEREFKAL